MRNLHWMLLLMLTWGCGGEAVDKDLRPDICVDVTACTNNDFCCPAGCTVANDDDCSASNGSSAVCGNGVVEPGELCDGDCPTSCTSTDPCSGAVLTGSPDQCNALCSDAAVTACIVGDSCCPAGCDDSNDGDCVAGCGNGILEPGELCDGDCPTSCDDAQACTADAFTGSASTCTAMCANTPINICVGGDACCPAGCTEANDTDCACVPTTCAAAGAECGEILDGCQATVSCPNTCAANEVCANNQCAPGGNGGVGDPCSSGGQCSGIANGYCETHADYSGGYCTAECQFDNDCPMGSHCARLVAGDPNRDKICMKNCGSDADCRAAGYACQNWDDFDQDAQVSDECGPAATGTGGIGEGCAGLADCDGGFCALSENTQQFGQVSFPGGSCTATCLPIFAPCAAGQVCSDASFCMPECITSLECRMGYTCITANFEMGSHCWPQ